MNKSITIRSFLSLLCLSSLLQYHSAIAQSTMGMRVDSLFTVYSDSGFTGCVLVAEKGAVTLKKGYGYANAENKKLNTPVTLFNVASVGKQFTTYSILLLETQGKLKEGDPLSRYIGPFNDLRDSATIHHLLLHTAGLVNEDAVLDYSTRSGFIRSVKDAVMDFPPGTEYRYSNAGYSLLAAVVEIVSGVPFEQFLSDNVFSPCKMENTGYPWEMRMNRDLFATGYDREGKPVLPQPDLWATRGPGNLMTSVEDLYRWMIAYQDQRFMPASMREKILQDYLRGKDTYSWNKKTTSRHTRFFHKGGGRSDFESQLMWYPDDDVVIIFCINSRHGLRSRLFSKIQNVMN